MTNLKIHFKMFHEEQKNFQCDSCEKFFTLKQNLKIHIKNVHEGKRNYKFDICRNIFSPKQNLHTHKNVVYVTNFKLSK